MYLVMYSGTYLFNGNPEYYGFSETYDTREEAEFWAENWRKGDGKDLEATVREF